MELCTIWLAIDPPPRVSGCMKAIPSTHVECRQAYSDYDAVNPEQNVFGSESTASERDDGRAVYLELNQGECSLHDARVTRSGEPNASMIRRCGWTMRFCSSAVRFNADKFDGTQVVYPARTRPRRQHLRERYAQ